MTGLHVTRGFRWYRLAAILLVGAAAMWLVHRHIVAQRPHLVPDDIARKAHADLVAMLAKVATSPFGQTERGLALTQEARRYLDDGRLLFAQDMGKVSLFRKEFARRPVVYVNVPRFSNGHAIPDAATLARAVYHEMLHSIQGTGCYEEECDAFVVGSQADAALRGVPLEFPVYRDGMTVAVWVRRVYRGKNGSPEYQPLGHDRAWLARASGAESWGSTATSAPDRRSHQR
jgi:hypothetical protein